MALQGKAMNRRTLWTLILTWPGWLTYGIVLILVGVAGCLVFLFARIPDPDPVGSVVLISGLALTAWLGALAVRG